MKNICATNKFSFIICMVFALLASACSIKQEITTLEAPLPRQVCIVEHKAVKNGVLIALQDSFDQHSIPYKVTDGVYELKNRMLNPRWQPEQTSDCDALLFYTARWSWDLATYMSFANIWMTTTDGNRKIAQAKYDATTGGGEYGQVY